MEQAPVEPDKTSRRERPGGWSLAAAIGLLALHATLAIDTIRQKSVTVDEVGHLPAGISYWQTGTFELYHHNPPLIKLLTALPALAAHPVADYSKSWESNRRRGLPLSPWAMGWEFMYANAARYHEIYFWGRLPVVALSLVAGAIIFLWARELFGNTAGVLAVALWSFCPNAIAHAGMVTTDMGATSLGFVATYFFWRYLRNPNWPRASAAGVFLGLAQLTKFSLLMLYGLWPVIWCVGLLAGARTRSAAEELLGPNTALKPKATQRGERIAPNHRSHRLAAFFAGLKHILAIALISLLIINAGYFFEGTGSRLGKFQFLSRSLTRPRTGPVPAVPPTHPWSDVIVKRQNRFQGTWLASFPVPLPREYVAGFDEQKLESEGINGQGYPVYLRGELRRTGWWYYYFYALAVKVPLGTWLLTLAAAAAALVRQSARTNAWTEFVLLAPPAATLIAMSFLTDINLGLRYVLPIFPFWFVSVSRVACWFETKFDAWRFTAAIVLGALVWNAARCAWVHPDHLAYFNELAGGPRNGYRHLIDSNLDWGQDLLALQSWLTKNRPGERVRLAYFGNVDPSILEASGRPIPFQLAPAGRSDMLRLVAPKPGGAFAEARLHWITEHWLELESWLQAQRALGRPASPEDHPEIRAMAFDRIGMDDGPRPGIYAISANLVAGLPFRIRDQDGNIWNAEQDAYRYFRNLSPIAEVGYSIFVYELSEEQINALRRDGAF